MKCMHVCAAQKAYLLFIKLLIKPDIPSLANEIAEPHLDMNIKVAAVTVSEKSSNRLVCLKCVILWYCLVIITVIYTLKIRHINILSENTIDSVLP